MESETEFYLSTPRLVLKSHTLANLARLNTWFNDPELNYYDGDDPPLEQPETLEQTRAHLERMMAPSDPTHIVHYAIHKNAGEELIGYGMVANIDRYHRRCDLGLTCLEWVLAVTTNRLHCLQRSNPTTSLLATSTRGERCLRRAWLVTLQTSTGDIRTGDCRPARR